MKCMKLCIGVSVKCKLLVTVSVTCVKQSALGVLNVTVVILVIRFWFIMQLKRLLEGLLQSVIVVKSDAAYNDAFYCQF